MNALSPPKVLRKLLPLGALRNRWTWSRTHAGRLCWAGMGFYLHFAWGMGWRKPAQVLSKYLPLLSPNMPQRDHFETGKSRFVSLVLVLEGQRQHFQGWYSGRHSVCKQGWIISLRTLSDLVQCIPERKMLCLWPWHLSPSLKPTRQTDRQTRWLYLQHELQQLLQKKNIPVPNCPWSKSDGAHGRAHEQHSEEAQL